MYKIINRKKLYATMLADAIGRLIFFPHTLFRTQGDIRPDQIKTILIIRTAYIGDVVMTLPMLAPIRQRFPHARISFLTCTSCAAVLQNNPYVDEILTYCPFWFYPTRKLQYFEFLSTIGRRQFDLVIETRGDIRELLLLVFPLKTRHRVGCAAGGGGYLLSHPVPYHGPKHRVDYHLDLARFLGCSVDQDMSWSLYLDESEQAQVDVLLANHQVPAGKAIYTLHPGSRKPLKCWPADRFAAIADWLAEETGCPVVLTGSPDEMPLVQEVIDHMKTRPVNLAGATTLRQLAAIIGRSALFVCNDSSPMHLAVAMNTPTIAIFGPSKSRETGPYGPGHQVVEKDFPCRFSCDEDLCHFPENNQCMKAIAVADVQAAIIAARQKSAGVRPIDNQLSPPANQEKGQDHE